MIYEENGQIIVDELRPMSEAPPDKWVIYFHKNLHSFEAKDIGHEIITSSDERVEKSKLLGWIYMPIYRPKAK